MPPSFKLFCCLFFLSCMDITISYGKNRCSSSCGGLLEIKYPFRLKDDPDKCGGNHDYEFYCEGNHTVFEIHRNKYYVMDILYGYDVVVITLLDVGLARGNCNLPDGSLSKRDLNRVFSFYGDQATFISCSVRIDDPKYESVPCLSKNSSTIYLIIDSSDEVGELRENCHFLSAVLVSETWIRRNKSQQNFQRSHFDGLKQGFHLLLEGPRFGSTVDAIRICAKESGPLFPNPFKGYDIVYIIIYVLTGVGPLNFEISFLFCLSENKNKYSILTIVVAAALFLLFDITLLILVFILIGRFLFAPLCLLSFLVYNLFKLMVPVDIVERFLQNQKALSPSRFSYNEIITITSNFKEKLGQGGFGSVFKGRLPGNYLVAVKMLGKSMGDGDDFINEVSTIGRIHHVNVVQLVGFCAEGSYRALVYEYMANGSLDKYIFSSNRANRILTMEKLVEIALSVAKGLHYLHQGCNMRILHFDIKPHNILLDHKFTPKISDFGLAKLHPKGHSLVSISAARGTIGYIAPELVSRSFGPISHKSDVYSFGMLLMDMAGGRRHTDMKVENSSEVYYPSWIYDQLQKMELSENIDIIEIGDLERKLCKVGLCCIQTRPVDRPSMINVVEMLEAEVDSLQMPPKPFFSSSDPMPPANYCKDSSLSELSIISENL